MIFGVDVLKRDAWISEFNENDVKCSSSGQDTIWDIFKSVNEDVLQEIKLILAQNPSCYQMVKCEISYILPRPLKK